MGQRFTHLALGSGLSERRHSNPAQTGVVTYLLACHSSTRLCWCVRILSSLIATLSTQYNSSSIRPKTKDQRWEVMAGLRKPVPIYSVRVRRSSPLDAVGNDPILSDSPQSKIMLICDYECSLDGNVDWFGCIICSRLVEWPSTLLLFMRRCYLGTFCQVLWWDACWVPGCTVGWSIKFSREIFNSEFVHKCAFLQFKEKTEYPAPVAHLFI